MGPWDFVSFAARSVCCAPLRMPNRWSRERSKGEATVAAVDTAGKCSEEAGRSPPQPVGSQTSANPHRVAFTVGQNLAEAHMVEFFSSHGVQALLDLRPQMLTSSGNLWTRRDLARLCSVMSVQLERRTQSPEVPNVQSLLAALRFSKPPTALLFAESDPRNAWRRELSDEVCRAGWHVLHVTAKFGELKVTPHQDGSLQLGSCVQEDPLTHRSCSRTPAMPSLGRPLQLWCPSFRSFSGLARTSMQGPPCYIAKTPLCLKLPRPGKPS